VGRFLAAAVAALVLATPARAFTKEDMRLPMSDGAEVAATLYLPDGAAPAGGWPAIIALHGLGQTRAASNVAAEQAFAPNGYAVLTADA
jgi:predicted acyl esterase